MNMGSGSDSTTSNNAFTNAGVVAWYSAFSLISVLIVTGNLTTITLFAVNKKLRKKCFFLIVNMAYADLLVGAVSLPLKVITPLLREARMSLPAATFLSIVSVVCVRATITFAAFISLERLCATCWPFKIPNIVRAIIRRYNYFGEDFRTSELCHTFRVPGVCFRGSLLLVLGAIHFYSHMNHLRL